MKLDVAQVLVGLDNKALQDDTGKDATLGGVCINALLTPAQDEQPIAGTEKMTRFALANRINDSDGSLDLAVEDVALIKERIGILYPPLIVGLAWSLLEGK